MFDVIGGRREPDGGVTEQADRWWGSWDQARAVGLGLEVTLPDGRGPGDISALYAVGLGDEAPDSHFLAKIDAGEFAVLPLGAPTNAVDGAQAAALGHSVEDWRALTTRRLWLEQTGNVDDPELTAALAGPAAVLPALPRPADREPLDRMLVRALWPALYGHLLRDVWGLGEDADRLGAWAGDHLAPEGPLPPLRIGTQAYGLLPTSAMSRWRTSVAEGPGAACAERIVPPLLALRARSADAARSRGTVVGGDTATLLDVIGRGGVSPGYAYRLFLPDELWAALYGVTTGVDRQQFLDRVQQLLDPAVNFVGAFPARGYLTAGGAEPLTIPLVTPTTWPPLPPDEEPGRFGLDEQGRPVPATVEGGLAHLLETLVRSDFPFGQVLELWRRVLPDSLLVRLLLLAGLLSAAAVVRADNGDPTPLLEPVLGDTSIDTVLRELAPGYSSAQPHDHPAGDVRREHEIGLERIYKMLLEAAPGTGLPARLERALRATLDSTCRADPWLIGIAAQRLRHLSEQPDTRFRLGVYGWVDGPILGNPGPTAGGLLHAVARPGPHRGGAARQVPRRTGSGRPWGCGSSPTRIRLAKELAEKVEGSAPRVYEALGRQVERTIVSRDGWRRCARRSHCGPARTRPGGSATARPRWPRCSTRTRRRCRSPRPSALSWSCCAAPWMGTATCWWPRRCTRW